MATGPSSTDHTFGEIDLRLLEAIRAQDQALRALLCTLARHGVAMRTRQAARAARWIDELSVHPLYKGGQFLFDLLEWEDFMLEGPPPPLLNPALAAAALQTLAAALQAVASRLDGREPAEEGINLLASDILPGTEVLPPLEPGFYLYRDVVLGALAIMLARLTPGGAGDVQS